MPAFILSIAVSGIMFVSALLAFARLGRGPSEDPWKRRRDQVTLELLRAYPHQRYKWIASQALEQLADEIPSDEMITEETVCNVYRRYRHLIDNR
ncbi:hypothetical protein K2Z83_26710 [Oscillochloris sp. ZM17-4]|uniref:hypothetical protein n=1 Tax=Oscillochloris sp. ZM17-4 TaxID=2866714 RepID=UPI001C73B76B|nr:hypothetical protein [Oscillochloris sp. ZM17-4]MBX0331245.1 hypothetical protein [Oscillochloris sp. ZM17-4]